MLEVVFNVLEGTLISIQCRLCAHIFAVLRFMQVNRQVLHRDISKGNVLYIEEDSGSAQDAGSKGTKAKEGEEVPLCFIRYLLKERCVEDRLELGLLT